MKTRFNLITDMNNAALRSVLFALLSTTLVVCASSNAESYDWCRGGTLGNVVERSSCVSYNAQNGGYTNNCNKSVFFYHCYTDSGAYACGYADEPTQFGGIASGGTTFPHGLLKRPIRYWVFTCER